MGFGEVCGLPARPSAEDQWQVSKKAMLETAHTIQAIGAERGPMLRWCSQGFGRLDPITPVRLEKVRARR